MWHGVLLACGIPVEVVHATSWKRQLNLCGAGKEGSLKLARDLFPSAEKLLQCTWSSSSAMSLSLAMFQAEERPRQGRSFAAGGVEIWIARRRRGPLSDDLRGGYDATNSARRRRSGKCACRITVALSTGFSRPVCETCVKGETFAPSSV